ncbi:hypothetical protein DEO72_LG6g379 [Vigna unguiculata]|uniref:Uncharacterized protein n=1 Tax=Vigna unguiculata TaxID=3917 RepID=A0A4D6M6S4_VIGUN|nr:hypothetical protein DEO72_LG6g379 [Vigna unguiculata]
MALLAFSMVLFVIVSDMSMKSEAREPIEGTHCISDPDCVHRPCASCACKVRFSHTIPRENHNNKGL